MPPIYPVFRGEFSIVRTDSTKNTILQTPSISTSVILTLHGKDALNEERSIAVLAHIDSHTSPTDTLLKIENVIERTLYRTIFNCGFTATLITGTTTKESTAQQTRLLKALAVFELTPKIISISESSQVRFDALYGKADYLIGKARHLRLEYLQYRESEEWNALLDRVYPCTPSDQLPLFQAKGAFRTEDVIPQFAIPDLSPASLKELQRQNLNLPIEADRTALEDKVSLASKDIPVRIVLQGEYAVVKGVSTKDSLILTSTPNTCSVLTLYSAEKRLAILTHIDDYTSVTDTISKIEELLRNKFHATLFASGFTANIMGGTAEAESVKQQECLLRALEVFKIAHKKIPLSKPSQIRLNARNGELTFLAESKRNLRLEFLQIREYGEWNNYLDILYPGISGKKIPFFQVKEARRVESSIPHFKVADLSPESIKALQAQRLPLPLHARREVAHSNTELDLKTTWNEFSGKFSEKARTLEADVQASHGVNQEDEYLGKIKKELEHLIETLYPNNNSLTMCIKEENFNLLLRRSCINEKYFALTEFLWTHRSQLKIDPTSTGATSGTALDVAKKNKNSKAIQLLEGQLVS